MNIYGFKTDPIKQIENAYYFNGGPAPVIPSTLYFMLTGLVPKRDGTFSEIPTNAQATASLSGGAVNGFTVTNGGTNYSNSPPPAVTITGGGGTGATATAVVNAQGIVASITLNAGGSGYTSAPTVSIAGNGYFRTAIAMNSTNWTVSNGLASNALQINLPIPTASWNTIGWGLIDCASGPGNLWYAGSNQGLIFTTSSTPHILPGALVYQP